MPERTVILHYHLFKNAGTSVDRILQANFGNRWVTREFPMNGGDNSALVAEWIENTPGAIAFSSHTMLGPIPRIRDTRIFSLLFLRDPIARIISAYEFERRQQVETLGSQLARDTSLEGYVQFRLATKGDRQCRNFQVARLAALIPGPEPELDRAFAALDQLSFIGRVEDFATSIADMQALFVQHFPGFVARSVHANMSQRPHAPLDADLAALLERNNQEDRLLLQRFDSRRASPPPPIA